LVFCLALAFTLVPFIWKNWFVRLKVDASSVKSPLLSDSVLVLVLVLPLPVPVLVLVLVLVLCCNCGSSKNGVSVCASVGEPYSSKSIKY
jgi:hypothetical protein